MFVLAIAFLGLATISAAFGVLGGAGGRAVLASAVLFVLAAVTMYQYWRRRPRELSSRA
jgi:hypothetical protein